MKISQKPMTELVNSEWSCSAENENIFNFKVKIETKEVIYYYYNTVLLSYDHEFTLQSYIAMIMNLIQLVINH